MRPERDVFRDFTIDANCINARQCMPAMNRLETWAKNGVIRIEAAAVSRDEAGAGGDLRRYRKTYQYVATDTCLTTDEDVAAWQQINQALFPGGASTQNEQNDVEIVFNAWQRRIILITTDGASKSQPGGILGNRDDLSSLHIAIMTPDEAVAHIEERIALRDHLAREWSRKTGEPLPDWVGQD